MINGYNHCKIKREIYQVLDIILVLKALYYHTQFHTMDKQGDYRKHLNNLQRCIVRLIIQAEFIFTTIFRYS